MKGKPFYLQIRGLMFSHIGGLAGVLTDGLRFDFFFLSRRNGENVEEEENCFELYKAPALQASDKRNINKIMGAGL